LFHRRELFDISSLILLMQKLKKIILEDELGICTDLDREMDALVGTYTCEWTEVVNDPERRKQFRQFVNAVSHSTSNFVAISHIAGGGARMIVFLRLNLSSSEAKPDLQIGRKRFRLRSLARVRWLRPRSSGDGDRWPR
jgi:nitrite reductase (NAD(P)H)